MTLLLGSHSHQNDCVCRYYGRDQKAQVVVGKARLYSMCRVLAVLFVSTLASPAYSAEGMSPIETLAFNNFHHEMVNCIAYYSIVTEGLRQRGDETTASQYRQLIETLFGRVFAVGKKIGMKDDAVQARIRMASKQQIQEIDKNFVNISILLEKYAYQCKTVMENPDARIQSWMKKAAE